ncbi:hypothetical protein B0H15DRAFT_160641 [Mycena belliarum]|uniref:Uncharacterized protein n=1 Tax=Mycena belliarum TaxID=1033014 RepID=A0AAD6XHM1_9AGAR|nr:hypothetical protein B0H15DRAFT_160641 [Mycena belliae]
MLQESFLCARYDELPGPTASESTIDIFNQTCRALSELTYDRSVWLHSLERLRRSGDVPLPPEACDPTVLVNLSVSTIESIVVSAARASESWLLPREVWPICAPRPAEALAGLIIFLDTWLLIVHANGLVYLWSLRENAPRRGHCATLDLSGNRKKWRSHCASLAPGNTHIMLAMSNDILPFETVLYQINIDGEENVFKPVRTFTNDSPRTICSLDAARQLLAFYSDAGSLSIVSWDDEKIRTSSMKLDDEDVEEWFVDIVALRLLGSHFLAIRTHTIELHALDAPKRGIRPLRHRLPFPLRDGSVSISDAIISPSSDSDSRSVRVNVLAYDAHSLVSYAVTVLLPDAMSADVQPQMDVTLTGEVCPVRPVANAGSRTVRYSFFVSTLALGPQAIRAMWIERHSLTMTRYVRLCTLNRNEEWHEMDAAASVFTLASYDLRDDLTHCALAEVSGRVVLGNRAGHVFLLTPTRAAPRQLN